MKQIVIVIVILVSSCSVSSKAQSTQDFLNSCVKEEQKKGAISILLSANLCSVCMTEPVFEGTLFIKDPTGTYKVRYLKYINGYENVKVLKDSIFTDLNIQEIFKIIEPYQDSIFWQLSNMKSLLTVKVVKDGKTMFREPLTHGKMRYVGLFHKDKYETSIHSIISLNEVFERAYYYWLLNSSINNYCNDYLKLRINCED